MYSNGRANLLLERKIIVDQDKKNYLLQSFLKKERWKDAEANTNRTDKKGIDKQKGVQSTIMTQHMEMEKDTVEEKRRMLIEKEDTEKRKK